jgi:hypothetical protein
MPDLFIEVERKNGETLIVDRGPRTQRAWGIVWSVLSGPPDRLREYYMYHVKHPDDLRVRFYRAHVSVVPEDKAPPRKELVLEISP